MWPELEMGLKVVQTAAVLEVVHSLVGLVKSPWVTALMQVFSRVWTLWAVMHVAPSAQTSIFTLLACSSWALVEVPRYAFYALNLLDAVPYPLLWLRYSLFAVLYPTGITGELGCMYMAALFLAGVDTPFDLDIAKLQTQPQENLALLALVVFVAVTYIPGSPTMYGHMVKTRKKQLEIYKNGGKAPEKKTKKAL
mmetsp:Transcript_22777/g.50657  ORF Transcript_22777/g.50657 Transcript_22777/m.50657 type:complete len:195 (-) Transcript_22777:92-676(-)